MEPPNPHFIKGDRVHAEADAFITSIGKKEPLISKELKGVTVRLQFLRKLKAQVERDWAFTKDYVPTSWFGDKAWLRVKTDACAVEPIVPPLIHIIDWKTGRVYDEHRQQRSLYALAGLQLASLGQIPGATKDSNLVAAHDYTDTGFTATETFTPKDLKKLKKEWASRICGMMSDTRYQMHEGFHCRFCRFRKSNGGPCQAEQ